MSTGRDVLRAIQGISPAIRYVALSRDGALVAVQAEGLVNASASDSDRYEEWIVNPTLLTLVKQRGEIDCGGAAFVLVRYGHFFQLVKPVPGGHLSVAVEPTADPLTLVPAIDAVLARHGFGREIRMDPDGQHGASCGPAVGERPKRPAWATPFR